MCVDASLVLQSVRKLKKPLGLSNVSERSSALNLVMLC